MVQQKFTAPLGERLEAKLGAASVRACFQQPLFKRLKGAVFANVLFDLVADE